jgi:hypothetical protein
MVSNLGPTLWPASQSATAEAQSIQLKAMGAVLVVAHIVSSVQDQPLAVLTVSVTSTVVEFVLVALRYIC